MAYLEINLTKEVKDLYKKTPEYGRASHAYGFV